MHARAHTEVYAEQPMLRASAPRRLRAASLRRCFSTRNGLANPNIAIAGASGAVGIEMLKMIESRGFPFNDVRLAPAVPLCATLQQHVCVRVCRS